MLDETEHEMPQRPARGFAARASVPPDFVPDSGHVPFQMLDGGSDALANRHALGKPVRHVETPFGLGQVIEKPHVMKGFGLGRERFAWLYAVMLIAASGNTAMQSLLPAIGRAIGIADLWVAFAFSL
jgi:hypothetical protein